MKIVTSKEFEQLIARIKDIGFAPDYCDSIQEQYRDDIDGLADLVRYLAATFDDRHEYVD